MQTIQRTDTITIANDVNHLTKWLETEYPRGIDLYYVDYRDNLDDNVPVLMQLIRDGYSDELDESMYDYDLSHIFDDIESNYLKSLDDVDEMSDDLRDAMREWCYEHDTSDYQNDLLRNTRGQLFFIDTGIDVYENNTNLSDIVRKFGKKDAKKIDAIKWIGREQMYDSTISFYFHADVNDIIKALHKEKSDYIAIDGAMIANVTRGNGSNWVHDDNIFQLVIPKKAFIANVYHDKEAGTGYGWHTICGDWNTNEAGITSRTTKTIKGYSYIEGETSLTTINEREYIATYKAGKCTRGDMNITRHRRTEYINEIPCGTHCHDCGNFWID